MLDIEFLARKRIPVGDPEGKYGGNGCVLATFKYRTRPELKVVQEGYQRGPVHIGRVEFSLRAYAWTDEQVAQYKKMKEEETFHLLGDVSASVRAAMESLGDALKQYVDEAREHTQKKKEEKKEEKGEKKEVKPKKSLMETFFGDFYTPKKSKPSGKYTAEEIKMYEAKANDAAKKLEGFARGIAFNGYKNFKKSHRMFQW